MLTFLLIACALDPAADEAPPVRYDPAPEAPAILRDVALIDDEVKFTAPYVPGHRTTMDGRVALRVQGGPPGTVQHATMLSFYLFAPEKLSAPVMQGPPGAGILADATPFDVLFPPAVAPGVERLGHHAICDPTTETPGSRSNPYPCGDDDCYDVTVVNTTSTGVTAQVWGTPVTVRVRDPKTASARIVDVALGEPVPGMSILTSNEFTEPAVTMDGRLLTGRVGRFPRTWIHPETGASFTRPYDLMYAQLPDDAAPCDVTQWTTLHPMSHAPYDDQMVGRYGLAAWPFRDTEGAPIPDGEDMGGTYPWVDREGANVFMTGVHGRIVEQSETKFPRRCVTPGCEAYRENTDWDRGFMVGGLWTHGKMVLLDGMINNLDWAVGVTPAAHWLVDLYRGADGAPVPVRFGAGRFIDEVRAIGGPYPDGYTHNANVLDSLQNLLTHHAATRPVTTRDVVWLMSSGVASHEVSFDELLDPNALIVANMNASITQLYAEDGASLAIPWHHNGQVRTLTSPISLFADYALDPDAEDDIHLQNGATSLRWAVPPYGFIAAGAARIEPVALGGVEGRGLWLSGDAAVTWAMPAQPRPVPALYVGLFVDLRADDGFARELLTFPDGTRLRLTPEALVVERGASRRETALPPRTGWRHLALLVRDGGRSVMVLHDGYPIDRLTLAEPALQVPAGTLTLGRVQEPFSGLRGWVDDLVVLAHDVDPETACNHARGTLVRPVDPEWTAVAAEAPAWAHSELAAALGRPPGESYACYTDLSADYAAGLANLPAGSEPLRHLIQFPEGPLRAGQPRPDSSRNPFCLSCHTPEERGALGVEALVFRPSVPAEVDPRRQPMQPAPRVFGHVPAGWIAPGPGPGGPAEDLVAPAEGLLVDRWLLPP